MMGSYARVALLACGALLAAVGSARSAESQRSFGAHLEAGPGPIIVRPLEVERTAGVTACGGVSVPVAGPFRAALEFAATGGGDWATSYFPESPRPGSRSLMTFLLGLEIREKHRAHGPFASFGAGGGTSTLKNARGVFAPPYGDNWIIPPRSVTAFAVGAGAGYRFGGGPGPLGFQLAYRAHALVDSGVPASAQAITLGLAY